MSNPFLFIPEPHLHPSAIVTYNPVLGLTQLKSDPSCIVISTDGACRFNGYSNARASYGIYFGRNSPFNTCHLIPPSMGAGGVGSTNNVAELYAVEAAILIASRIKSYMVSQGMEIQQIIVKTDSSYVSETLSRHVWRWWWDPRAQVYLNARGQPRKNSHLIHGIKRWLYDDPNQNFRVKFWRVRREQNADADRLANIALNEYSEPEYDSRDLFEHNFPWESWKYQFEYQPRDMATALAADEVIQRLEFPLETHNEWSRSVAFFLIQQAEGARYWPKNDQPIVHCQIRDLIFKGATTDIQEICMRYFGSRASVELENATSRQDDFNNYVVKIPLGILLEHLLKSDLADLQARKVRI